MYSIDDRKILARIIERKKERKENDDSSTEYDWPISCSPWVRCCICAGHGRGYKLVQYRWNHVSYTWRWDDSLRENAQHKQKRKYNTPHWRGNVIPNLSRYEHPPSGGVVSPPFWGGSCRPSHPPLGGNSKLYAKQEKSFLA